MSGEVVIVVNGESRAISAGLTVKALLEELGIAQGKVAVERNRAIVPKSVWGEVSLQTGDAIEIVQFVGGG